MKDTIARAIKLIIADRPVLLLLAGLVLASIAYCIFVALSLQPIDLQVAVHYTAYG